MIVWRYRSIIILIFFILSKEVDAQLCTGSLGDPIVNVTFGQGSNPGSPLTAAATTYQFVAADCPNDGFYTVANKTTNCFSSSWHSLAADHTGDAGGYFMLINASYQPGAFYIDTVKNLCPGTTYELSAWIMNVLMPSACSGNGIRPNISFAVEKTDGTVIQSYNTGDINSNASPQWKKYGFFFNLPVGVSQLVLRIVNNAPGGCGNDLALDDISFRACGPGISLSIDNAAVNEVEYCEGPAKQFFFKATASGGFSSPVFQWQRKDPSASVWSDIAGATIDNYTAVFPANASPGLYQFRVAVAESGNMGTVGCRVYSQPLKVIVQAIPVVTVSNDGPVCTDHTATLQATGGGTYNWTGPSGFTGSADIVLLNNVQPINAGTYNVIVTSAAGCINNGSTDLVVNPVPTASVVYDDSTICIGKTIQLLSGGGGTYEWKPSTNLSDATDPSPFASPTTTTGYSVIVKNGVGCTDTAIVHITVIQKPKASAGPDKIIFKGQSVQLNGAASAGDLYMWGPNIFINDVTSLDPVVSPLADQEYFLTVTSSYGCGETIDAVKVKVFNDLFVPTAFTPDNNGRNDSWNILGLGALKIFKVSVYDRWGQLVFYTENVAKGWDGKFKGQEQPAGIYVYYIDTDGFRPPMKGTLVLIR